MPQMRRASEILYKAHREGVGEVTLALELLSCYGNITRVGVILLDREYTNRYNTSVGHDNDVENLSFKEIGDTFCKIRLLMA